MEIIEFQRNCNPFSKLNIGDEIKPSNLNNALKELYETNYFKDVSIKSNDGVVYIKVDENPIIQSIIINGIDKELMKIYRGYT